MYSKCKNASNIKDVMGKNVKYFINNFYIDCLLKLNILDTLVKENISLKWISPASFLRNVATRIFIIMWFAFVTNIIFLWDGTVLGHADKSFTQIVF